MVERGVDYSGVSAEVRDWVRVGQLDFPSLPAALHWLTGVSETPPEPPVEPTGTLPLRRRAGELTDLTAVEGASEEPRVCAADLAARLLAQVVGQDAILNDVARAAARHTAKRAPRRPLTMLFVGPTAVGKTSAGSVLARALSELTGDRWGFLRLDMAEYSEAHTVARLHGAPPGYVGYADGQSLADALRSGRPHVVVFDEIDKAHPSVFRALLGLMDAGRLNSAGSHDASAAVRSILIFTSNAAADELLKVDRTRATADVNSESAAILGRAGISPELLGRIALVSVFSPLTNTDRAEVAVLSIERVAHSFGVDVAWIEPAVISRLLAATARSTLGVRALEHEVERQLGDLFSRYESVAPASIDMDEAGFVLAEAGGSN